MIILKTEMEYDLSNLFLNSSDPELEYRRRKDEEKISVSWGQRKLLFILLEFISLYWDNKKYKNPVLVYAGAAPGFNIKVVSKLFPEIEFHLYDPAKFKIKPTNKIHIYQQYFTNKEALEWSESQRNVYFVSDIRTADHTVTKTKLENEEQIQQDMQMQMEWFKIIKPIKGHLKFRLPYYYFQDQETEVEYLDGVILKQPWAPQTSTETRLVPFEEIRMKKWDIRKYESQMFHHNVIVRERHKYLNPFTKETESIDPNELLNDWDSLTEVEIIKHYLKKRSFPINLENVRKFSRLITKLMQEGKKINDSLELLRTQPQRIKKRNTTQSRESDKIRFRKK